MYNSKKQIEEDLRKSQKQIVNILESIADPFIVLDRDLRYTYLNREAEKHLARQKKELLGKKILDVFPQFDHFLLEKYRKAIRENKSAYFEFYSTESEKWFQVIAYPIEDGLLTYFRDISGEKLTEREMARLESLNLIGQMAGSLGHELRNPMTTVRGLLQLLGSKEECAEFADYFKMMIAELDRANSIITLFLSLAKNRVLNLQPNNLKAITESLYHLLQADAVASEKNIVLELQEVPELCLDEGEIRQLILNLVRNGLEAMPPGKNLVIKVYSELAEVILSVQDQGSGIKPEIIEQLGTPFFTTKESGTGLGLAVCYSIVERHKGSITLETGPTGTTFFIRFNK